jgi:hypothetical protein
MMDADTPSAAPVDLDPTPVVVVAEPAPAVQDAPAPAPAPAADPRIATRPERGEFIVLVESPANGQGQAIASTKGKAQYWMLANDERLRKRMEGRRKQFFFARTRVDGKGLRLGKYAPYQDWW